MDSDYDPPDSGDWANRAGIGVVMTISSLFGAAWGFSVPLIFFIVTVFAIFGTIVIFRREERRLREFQDNQ